MLNPLSSYRLARKAVKEGSASEHLAGSLRSGETGSLLAGSPPEAQTPQNELNGYRSGGGQNPWPRFSAEAAPAHPSSTGLAAEPMLPDSTIVGEPVALDLTDLQLYPPWNLEGLVDPIDARMEDSGQAAWLRFGDRAEIHRGSQ